MTFASPAAILLKLGPITIRWYGVMIMLGFMAALALAGRLATKRKLDEQALINCALSVFVGGIVGARLYWVALNWQQFAQNTADIIATWKGGMSIHGGLIGGLLVAILYCKRAKQPFLKFFDILCTTGPLAQAIGRWGNFFNSEAFGSPVDENFPLRLFIPPESRPAGFHAFNYYHPTFLYESAWDLLLFCFLYFFASDRLKKWPGVTSCVYLFGYSIGRILVEPLRLDSIKLQNSTVPFPLIASFVSLAVALAGIGVLIVFYSKKNPDTTA